MATVTQPIPAIETSSPVQEEFSGSLLDFRHRITVEEYHRMAEAGVFGPEPRLELLEGVLIDKMTKNLPHVVATDLLGELLHHLLPRGSGYFISMGNPVTIEDRHGEPEPDAMILRGNLRDCTSRNRTPADAALVIEVANTSYAYDRFSKWVTYAGARVPIYWIVDLSVDDGWRSTPNRPGKLRPRISGSHRSSARTMKSLWCSTAVKSPALPSAKSCRER
ncbi:MAG: Uma2 family endonuclease [Isosphaeraceae bacterium]